MRGVISRLSPTYCITYSPTWFGYSMTDHESGLNVSKDKKIRALETTISDHLHNPWKRYSIVATAQSVMAGRFVRDCLISYFQARDDR